MSMDSFKIQGDNLNTETTYVFSDAELLDYTSRIIDLMDDYITNYRRDRQGNDFTNEGLMRKAIKQIQDESGDTNQRVV